MDIDEELRCPICFERFSSPRSLNNCLHTFCEDCLFQTFSSYEKKNRFCYQFPCPVCRKTVERPTTYPRVTRDWVKTFPINHVVNSMLNIAVQCDGSEPHCEPCTNLNKTSEAANFCMECQEFMCNPCCQLHKNFKSTKFHDLVTVQELKADKKRALDLSKFLQCQLHKDKHVELFCVDDNMPVCVLCVATNHRNCTNVVELKAQAESSDVFEKSKQQQERLEKIQDSLIFRISQLEQNEEDLNAKESAIKKTIDQKRTEVLSVLHSFEYTVLKEVTQLRQNKLRALNEDLTKSKCLLSSIKSSKVTFDTVVKYGSQAHTFVTLGRMQNQFEQYEHLVDQDHSEINHEIIKLVVRPPLFNFLNANCIGYARLENYTPTITPKAPTETQETAVNQTNTSTNNLQSSTTPGSTESFGEPRSILCAARRSSLCATPRSTMSAMPGSSQFAPPESAQLTTPGSTLGASGGGGETPTAQCTSDMPRTALPQPTSAAVFTPPNSPRVSGGFRFGWPVSEGNSFRGAYRFTAQSAKGATGGATPHRTTTNDTHKKGKQWHQREGRKVVPISSEMLVRRENGSTILAHRKFLDAAPDPNRQSPSLDSSASAAALMDRMDRMYDDMMASRSTSTASTSSTASISLSGPVSLTPMSGSNGTASITSVSVGPTLQAASRATTLALSTPVEQRFQIASNGIALATFTPAQPFQNANNLTTKATTTSVPQTFQMANNFSTVTPSTPVAQPFQMTSNASTVAISAPVAQPFLNTNNVSTVTSTPVVQPFQMASNVSTVATPAPVSQFSQMAINDTAVMALGPVIQPMQKTNGVTGVAASAPTSGYQFGSQTSKPTNGYQFGSQANNPTSGFQFNANSSNPNSSCSQFPAKPESSKPGTDFQFGSAAAKLNNGFQFNPEPGPSQSRCSTAQLNVPISQPSSGFQYGSTITKPSASATSIFSNPYQPNGACSNTASGAALGMEVSTAGSSEASVAPITQSAATSTPLLPHLAGFSFHPVNSSAFGTSKRQVQPVKSAESLSLQLDDHNVSSVFGQLTVAQDKPVFSFALQTKAGVPVTSTSTATSSSSTTKPMSEPLSEKTASYKVLTKQPVPEPVSWKPLSEPVSWKPLSVPILTGAVSGPILTGAVSGPILTGAVSGPILTGAVSGPILTGAVSGPILTGAVSGPILTGAVSGPILTGAVSGPILTGAVSGPVSGKPLSGSILTAAVSGPISTTAVSGPILTGAVSGPISTGSAFWPISTTAVSGPILTGAVSRPISTKAVSGPISTTAVSGPILTGAVSRPISTKAVSGPISTTAVSGPILTGAVSRPISTKAVSGPISTKAVSGPISTAAVSGPISTGSAFWHISIGAVSGQISTGVVSELISIKPNLSKPILAKPVLQSIPTKPVSQPNPAKPVSLQILAKPVSQPNPAKPVSDSITIKPVSEPVFTKPLSESIPTKPVSQPISTKPLPRPNPAKPVSETNSTKPVLQPISTKPVSEPNSTKPLSQQNRAKSESMPVSAKPASEAIPTTSATRAIHANDAQQVMKEAANIAKFAQLCKYTSQETSEPHVNQTSVQTDAKQTTQPISSSRDCGVELVKQSELPKPSVSSQTVQALVSPHAKACGETTAVTDSGVKSITTDKAASDNGSLKKDVNSDANQTQQPYSTHSGSTLKPATAADFVLAGSRSSSVSPSKRRIVKTRSRSQLGTKAKATPVSCSTVKLAAPKLIFKPSNTPPTSPGSCEAKALSSNGSGSASKTDIKVSGPSTEKLDALQSNVTSSADCYNKENQSLDKNPPENKEKLESSDKAAHNKNCEKTEYTKKHENMEKSENKLRAQNIERPEAAENDHGMSIDKVNETKQENGESSSYETCSE